MRVFHLRKLHNLYLVLTIFIVAVLGCVNPKSNNDLNSNSNSASQNIATNSNGNKNSSTENTSIEDSQEFKKLSSAEHLAEAKKLYENKPSDYEIYVVSLHLKAIPETAPEFKEAQEMLKQIEKYVASKKVDEEVENTALQIVAKSWRRGAFGTARIWTVTFYNKGDKPIGDIEYQTRYYSETGNDVGGTGGIFTSGEVQKIIPPHQKRTIKINDGFINKEAVKGSFKVTNWKYVE